MKRISLLLGFFLFLGLGQGWAQFGPYFPEGTTITGSDGDTLYTFCPDGNSDLLRFRLSNKNALFAYVVTTPDGTILNVSTKNFFDFDQLPEGEYRVYAFVYFGAILAQPGGNLFTDPLASVYYELTTNFVTINMVTPDGGEVTTTEGDTSVFACPGDGEPDVIFFATTSPNTPYTYLITDEDNIILDLAPTGNYDFEDSPAGVCRVWGLAYAGTLLAEPGDTADVSQLASECYGLSNTFLEVVKSIPDGGQVSLTNGDTLALVCAGDGVPDFFEFSNNSTSLAKYSFLLATEDDNLFIQLAGNALDFDVLPAGIWKMYGVSFTGDFLAENGDNLFTTELADGCFELSENFVEIQVQAIPESNITLNDGSLSQVFCANDGNPDLVQLVTDFPDNQHAFLLTDADNVILENNFLGNFDLTNLPPGTYRGWGVGYSGTFLGEPGLDADTDPLSDECFRLSNNFIELIIEDVNGGTVELEGGGDQAFFCPSGPQPKVVSLASNGASGSDFAYLVTNANGVIIEVITNGNTSDFAGRPLGNYQIFGLGYTGNLDAVVGLPITEPLSDECFSLSSNAVSVSLQEPEGGSISTPDGQTEVIICPGDSLPDFVDYVLSGDSAGATTYLITDTLNEILAVTDSTAFDFNTAPVGYCRIWGLTYTGNLLAAPGQDAGSANLSDDCFDLSDNFITVGRFQPDGGTVSTIEGDTVFSFCPGNGNASVIQLINTSAAPTSYAYIATDTNNIVLDATTADTFDVESFTVSPVRFWGVAYTGNFAPNLGAQADTALFSDDCFDLSDNFVLTSEATPFGGDVSLVGGDTTIALCTGDGVPDSLFFLNTGNPDNNYAYVITNDQDTVLAVTTSDNFDFDGAGGGICYVYGLSYAGNLTVMPGQDINQDDLADDCFDLSANRIVVNRNGVDGGQINSSLGDETVYVCRGDGQPDLVTFFNDSNEPGANYAYLITATNNLVFGQIVGDTQDFELTGGTILRVWGVSYTGDLVDFNAPGAPPIIVGVDSLSNECFDLSENFITVVRGEPDGGTIATESGEDVAFDLCLGGASGVVSMSNTSNSLVGYLYLVTDEQGNILATGDDDKVDFSGFDLGTYRIYGLSYTGSVADIVGKNIQDGDLASSCFELAANFITVTIQDVLDGGTLANGNNGLDPLYSCPGDGEPDLVIIDVTTTTPDDNYRVVITDTANIVTIPNVTVDVLDFDDAPQGIFRIWGVAFTGTLNVSTGTDLFNDVLSDSCAVLSNNFLTVINQAPDAGTVSLAGSMNTDTAVIVGDGLSDLLTFSNTSPVAQRFQYILTDENDLIQFVLPLGSNTFDFESSLPGISRVYGVSYTGTLIAPIGGVITQLDLSESCFDLSDNFITVTKGSDLPPDPIYINAGGPEYIAPDGRVFIADEGGAGSDFSQGGSSFSIGDNNDVACTEMDPLYRSERFGQYSWDFPDLPDGNYVVELFFCEIFHGVQGNSVGEPGDRVFSLEAEGNPLETDFDILDPSAGGTENGSLSALVKTYSITVSDGNGLQIELFRGPNGTDQPKISALGVRPDNGTTINYGPVLAATEDLTVTVGETIDLAFDACDADQDLISLTLDIPNATGFSFVDNGDGTASLTWNTFPSDTGSYTATVTASDGTDEVQQSFGITVEALPPGLAAGSASNGLNPDAELRLAPNPATNLLNVYVNVPVTTDRNDASQLLLLNATGQLVRQENLSLADGENLLNVDVYDLAPGMYILIIQRGEERYLSRFLKN